MAWRCRPLPAPGPSAGFFPCPQKARLPAGQQRSLWDLREERARRPLRCARVYRQHCRWCLGSSEAAPNLGHLSASRRLSQGAFLLPATGGAVGPRSPWASG